MVAGLVAAGREGDVVRSLQTDLAEVLLLQVLVSDTTWLNRLLQSQAQLLNGLF